MSEIKVDTLTGKTSAGDITVTSEGGAATMQLQQGLAKCWVDFNGITTTSSRDSFNVSSLTDGGTGNTTITFANTMSSSNYTGSWFTNCSTATTHGSFDNVYTGGFGSRTTTSYGVYCYGSTGTIDSANNDSTIFGDLA
jgi:hypothetical protein